MEKLSRTKREIKSYPRNHCTTERMAKNKNSTKKVLLNLTLIYSHFDFVGYHRNFPNAKGKQHFWSEICLIIDMRTILCMCKA